MRRTVALVCAGLFVSLADAVPSVADDLPVPEDQVILTVSGAIETANQAETAVFDRTMLEALPQVTIRTTTSWTDGVTEFEGPRVADVLESTGANGETVTAIALNDYAVPIPANDFEEYDVILALRMNGETMSRRDKGPIWIIYPRDDFPELATVEYNARWVWQLRELRVE